MLVYKIMPMLVKMFNNVYTVYNILIGYDTRLCYNMYI